MKPRYFATPAAFRSWLEEHHASSSELEVGFSKRGSGKASITWPEAVDQALCFGWIDGVRHHVDGERYTIRFTPRGPRSKWSAINIARAKELTRAGAMHPNGTRAFEQRDEKAAGYSYEQRRTAQFDAPAERAFRANRRAWAFFEAQAPSYRRVATWWVVSAKKDDTRRGRLAALIEESAHERRIGPLSPPKVKR